MEAQNNISFHEKETMNGPVFRQVDISSLKSLFAQELFIEKINSIGVYTQTKLVGKPVPNIELFSKPDVLIADSSIQNIIRECLILDLTVPSNEKTDYINNKASIQAVHKAKYKAYFKREVGPGDEETAPTLCEDAAVFCGSSAYNFPGGTNSGQAQTGPNYGCLSSQPNPAWYFMQIENSGSLVITMFSTPSVDIDFICWGPFSSPTGACENGLTAPNIVDCSYSSAATEYCDIPNGIQGQFYILMITNFSGNPCNITFSQTSGVGTTNCEIVINCSMLSISTSVSACNPATNTYSVSGNMEFSNAPTSGTLIIGDNTGISQTFSPPFNSPKTYTLNNIPCDGNNHVLTAHFSADAACTLSQNYSAPQASCPIASIKGGGSVCNDGSTVQVLIEIAGGIGPYDFTYTLDGVPTTITGYMGTSYIINTSTPGNYTLVNVQNSLCPGTVSGLATVVLNPLPVVSLGNDTTICHGGSIILDAGDNFESYVWSTTEKTRTISVITPGTYTVQVTDANGCNNSDQITVAFHPAIGTNNIRHY